MAGALGHCGSSAVPSTGLTTACFFLRVCTTCILRGHREQEKELFTPAKTILIRRLIFWANTGTTINLKFL